MLRRRKQPPAAQPPPEQIYTDLRAMALGAGQNGVIQRHDDHPEVYGLVVDIPAQGGHATLVALGGNTTSFYTSTGGGTIGAGERPQVAAATQQLLTVVQENIGLIVAPDEGGLPNPGSVRLHLLAEAGLRSADVPEDAFWGRSPHPLWPVIAGIQQVISLIRMASPP